MGNQNSINKKIELSWPVLYDNKTKYSKDWVGSQVDYLSKLIISYEIKHEDTVGLIIYSDLMGVLISFSVLNLGLRVIFISPSEPVEKIINNLKTVNYKLVFVSCEDLFDKIKNKIRVKLISKNYWSQNKSVKPGINNISRFVSLLQTSGTSAKPKIVHTRGSAHLSSACAVGQFFKLDSTCCWGLNLPLYHVSGLSILFRALSNNISVCIFNKYNQEQVLAQNINTHVSMVPTQLKRLLEKKYDLSYLRAVILGGDKLDLKLRTLANINNISLYQTYGLTESSSMVYVEKLFGETSAHVLSHAQIKTNSKDQILLKSSSLCDGYVENNQLKFIDSNNFFTGDLGFFDNLGWLKIIGRMSNRIIRGGENIQAEEVEQEIIKFTEIRACVVFGLPDNDLGEVVHAVIAWEQNIRPIEELKLFLRKKLSYFKIPQTYHEWPYGLEIGLKISRSYLKKYIQHQLGFRSAIKTSVS